MIIELDDRPTGGGASCGVMDIRGVYVSIGAFTIVRLANYELDLEGGREFRKAISDPKGAEGHGLKLPHEIEHVCLRIAMEFFAKNPDKLRTWLTAVTTNAWQRGRQAKLDEVRKALELDD